MLVRNLLAAAAAIATAAGPALADGVALTRPAYQDHHPANVTVQCYRYPAVAEPHARCDVLQRVKAGGTKGYTLYFRPDGVTPFDHVPSEDYVGPPLAPPPAEPAPQAPPASQQVASTGHHLQHSPTDECEADESPGNAYLGCYHKEHPVRDVLAIGLWGTAVALGSVTSFSNTGPIRSPSAVRGGSCGGCIRSGF